MDGREISLRVSSNMAQWRLGTDAWQNLLSLDSLRGKDGATYLWDAEHGAWMDIDGLKGEKGDSMNIDDLMEERKNALCHFNADYQL